MSLLAEMTLGAKVERMMQARGIQTQKELALLAGLGQSTVSGIITGQQDWATKDNMTALARALAVPLVYLVSDDPREYIAARLINLSPEENDKFWRAPLHRKVFWLLSDAAQKWDGPFSIEQVAAAAGMSLESVTAMRDGRTPLSDHFLAVVSDIIGVPLDFLSRDHSQVMAADLPPAYGDLAEMAYNLSLDPDLVFRQMMLLHEARTGKRDGV